MARRETILDLLERLAPDVGKAFEESIRNMRSDVRIGAVESAIAEYMRNPSPDRVQAVIGLLNLDDAYFTPLDRAMRGAYEQGGDWAVDQLVSQARGQGVQISARFNSRNERAERVVRERSSWRITEILDDKREVVRTTLANALERGTAPRTVARDLVGRINRATGRREGGIVGLHSEQAAQAQRVYDILRDDPRAYFVKDRKTGRWKPRYKGTDRRMDATVLKAIREGKPVPVDQARAIVTRYRGRLLQQRGETIARTELLGSLNAAQDEGLQQMIDKGHVAQDAVESVWDAALDGDTREEHRGLDGQRRRQGEPFVSPSGYQLLYPGDTSLGAPAEMVINCRCIRRVSVSFVDNLGPGD